MFKPDFVTKKIQLDDKYGKFVITPLPKGYGHSIGNALRRVVLSSIEGAAVTYVKIDKTVHPFSTIEGVKESVLEIILNLKLLRFSVVGEGPFKMHLGSKGTGVISATEFKGGDVEIINSEQYIAEVTKDKKTLDIEIIIENGIGYSPSEEKEKKSFGLLPVDSVFSPVVKANYAVDVERVGRKSNFDKLTFEVWTDGTINPQDAFKASARTLATYYSYMFSGKDVEPEKSEADEKASEPKKVDEKVYETIIDELDLPTRVINALLREKIETIGDLVTRGRDELVNLKGVGRKSIDLIDKELQKLDVAIKD